MAIHRLNASQLIPRPIEEVFAFFAAPQNLARLTPPAMRIEFLSRDFDMRPGLVIRYRLRPLFGIPSTWETRIEGYDPPHAFADIQLNGPYRRWEHHHSFEPVDGGTLVRDEVTYELPLGPFGSLGYGWLVRPELERIFRYRARALDGMFRPPAPNPAPRTVAVAGATGFVGGAIALELYRRGNSVIALSRKGEAGRGPLPDAVEIRRVDVTSKDADLVAALRGADSLVIALAFRNSPVEAPRRGQTFEAVDAAGTERLVAAAGAAGVGQVVYLSGAGAAPDAPRHWFRAKWRAEQAVRKSGLTWTIIRPTWIYGPGDVSLNRFLGFARRLGVVPMTNLGRQAMAPVFIDDVARLAADSLVDPAAANQLFELGGPDEVEMREVIGQALAAARIRRPIVPGPAPLIKLAALPLTVLPEPPLTPDAVDFINQAATVDVRPLLARMPRRLTPLREGLASYLAPTAGPGHLEFDGG